MNKAEQMREQAIQNVAQLLRNNPFNVEFKVVKKPKGIKVIYEVTQAEMDMMLHKAAEKEYYEREQQN